MMQAHHNFAYHINPPRRKHLVTCVNSEIITAIFLLQLSTVNIHIDKYTTMLLFRLLVVSKNKYLAYHIPLPSK